MTIFPISAFVIDNGRVSKFFYDIFRYWETAVTELHFQARKVQFNNDKRMQRVCYVGIHDTYAYSRVAQNRKLYVHVCTRYII